MSVGLVAIAISLFAGGAIAWGLSQAKEIGGFLTFLAVSVFWGPMIGIVLSHWS